MTNKRKKPYKKNALYSYVKKLDWHENRQFYKKCREDSQMHANRTSIYKWIMGYTRPTAYHAIVLEKITKKVVTKEQLRPDIFGHKK